MTNQSERMKVLDLVKEQKISVDEAVELLLILEDTVASEFGMAGGYEDRSVSAAPISLDYWVAAAS